ncbi:low temperature requirement protein A [Kitasatospora paracochleata]|uniref:Low temperature requirement protein LtrA n=1 Tax=Kitasatospora paracochleata TaxID=58354 RepID=A0ABT1J045_9ACTN|nr:low temperature requirement protein A [Kitasatospora paracochleata]MCP2310790.1 low temperature requirement protein LtrA [Kitasatospora paracochleata]
MSGEPAPAAQVPSEAESEEHRAGWFELFFDLVFVVTVAVLAQGLHGNPSAADFGTFLVLFFPAWWAWANLMVTVNVLGSGVPRIQAMLLGAMPGLGLMAAAAPDGLGNRAWAYALGAAWVRLVFFVIWWGQVRRPDEVLPQWRPLLYGLVPALLWAVSAVVPGPGRFVLWGAAMALEVALLAITSDPSAVLYEQLSAEHLVERISLFVVIVLGESVFTVVATLAGHFVRASALAALLGFVVVAELAMVFFLWGTTAAARGLDRAQAGRANRAIRDTVMYLPFVLIAGITVLSGALGTAVAEPVHHLPPGARWALCGGVLAFYTANAAIALRYGDPVRSVFGWYGPCLLFVIVGLVPASVWLPAWAAVGVAAAVVLAMAKLAKYRIRRGLHSLP